MKFPNNDIEYNNNEEGVYLELGGDEGGIFLINAGTLRNYRVA